MEIRASLLTIVTKEHNTFISYAFNESGIVASRTDVTGYDPPIMVYRPRISFGPWIGMAWHDLATSERVWFNVIAHDGTVPRIPILLSENGMYPRVASDGETYLVAWRDGEDIWNADIAIARIGCP